MTDTAEPRCPLCHDDGGELLYRDDRLRIVLVDDADHPGFLRVIWTAHVKEMTDLTPVDRAHCMSAVYAAETALREVLHPDKINLASFGNMVPHVHWHVIPRFADDAHFPNAVWGERRREGARALPTGFRTAMAARLTTLLGATPSIRTIAADVAVLRMLADGGLPVDDLRADSSVQFFGAFDGQTLEGVVGLERAGVDALLRSLVVLPDRRDRGLGGALVAHAERRAAADGVHALYLLTTTAADFFAARGYQRIAREAVPTAVAATAQFVGLCPSSSTCMVKRLA